MPTLGDYLQSQDSLNAQAAALMPAVSPQLAPDLAQRSAQAITATSPQLSRQDQSAMMGGLTPSAMRSMMAPQRGGMNQANLDFSPVQTWSEGLSGGIGNAMAMRQANQQNQFQRDQQAQMMDFYRQQQQAVLEQEQAKQQAEQQKVYTQAQAVKNLIPGLSDEQAVGVVLSEAAKGLFDAYKPVAQQGLAPQIANMQNQQLQAVNPALAQGGQPVPITPIQQQQANVITGAPAAQFNQYTPQQNYFDTQAKAVSVGKGAQELSQATALQPLEVKAKAVSIQGDQLGNVAKQFENSVAPINQQIKELEAQGKIDEAAQKRADMDSARQLLDATMGNLDNLTPAQRAGVSARLKSMGLSVDIPDVAKPQTVGTGKQTLVVAPNGQLVNPQDYNRMVQQPVTMPQQPAQQPNKPKNVKSGNILGLDLTNILPQVVIGGGR